MFEKLRRSLHEAMSRASSPSDRHAVLVRMREALVEAKVGVSQIRSALDATRAQLERERQELETVRRRGRLAGNVHDDETVRVAERFERKHADRVGVLERKAEAQAGELALAEGEVAEMTAQLKAMQAGVDPLASTGSAGSGRETEPSDADPLAPPGPGAEALRREVDRAAREGQAQRQLEELKRRMGRKG